VLVILTEGWQVVFVTLDLSKGGRNPDLRGDPSTSSG
jgi:hypothetical protein